MQSIVAQVTKYLHCPDDKAPLTSASDHLQCTLCRRTFPVHAGRIVELLPRAPILLGEAVAPRYRETYVEEFRRPFELRPMALAWQAPEDAASGFVRHRMRQVQQVKTYILRGAERSDLLLCDVSGGAGYYTLEYSPLFQYVLHCDLSVDALNYVLFKTQRMGLQNVILIRADYNYLPFSHSVPVLLCFDTLIFGEEHELRLLQSIARALTPAGTGFVDFHNWWHNPLARLGLVRSRFGGNRSYSRHEVELLLRAVGYKYEFSGFYQEVDAGSAPGRVATRLWPPTRLVYRIAPGRTA
jgi:SAM-dependent methyltransferase